MDVMPERSFSRGEITSADSNELPPTPSLYEESTNTIDSKSGSQGVPTQRSQNKKEGKVCLLDVSSCVSHNFLN